MKKIWSAPEAIAEQFAANEYVAACYLVNCNVPTGYGIYSETNGVAGLQTSGSNADKRVFWPGGAPYGCQKWHGGIIRTDAEGAPEINGYWVTDVHYSIFGETTYDYVEVFWWNENLGSTYSYHASTSPESYQTNPNAS